VRTDCAREQDLLDALASDRWPERCDDELRAHVAACGVCSDVLAVALPLLREHEAASAEAQVPTSAVVWWRAEMRARQEAARAAARPIAVVQGLAFACVAGLVAAFGGVALPLLRGWTASLPNVKDLVSLAPVSLATLQSLVPTSALAWTTLALCLLIAPVAIYFATND
jgi:hypothetical protein